MNRLNLNRLNGGLGGPAGAFLRTLAVRLMDKSTFTRASPGRDTDPSGVVSLYAIDIPRTASPGTLIEGVAVNLVTNPLAIGGATPGAIPTGWGTSALDASMDTTAATIWAGQTTINGVLCQLVRFTTNGANIATTLGRVTLGANVLGTAALGLTFGAYVALYAGTLPAGFSCALRLASATSPTVPITITGTLTRRSAFFAHATDVSSPPQLTMGATAGAPCDFTLAIGLPNAVDGNALTSPVSPAAGATGTSTRLQDNMSLTGAAFSAVFDTTGTTNQLTYSNDLTNAAWTKNNVTITAGAIALPDGTLAAKVVETTSTTGHGPRRSMAITGQVTVSAYFKAAERSYLTFLLSDNGGSTGSQIVNLVAGTITQGGTGQPSTGKIEAFANGWYRVSVTFTPNTTLSYFDFRIADSLANATNLGASYTGDGTSGLYVGNFQLETGLAATQYVNTTAATVTKPGASAGCVILDVNLPVVSGPAIALAEFSDLTYGNRIFLYSPGGTPGVQIARSVDNNLVFSALAAGTLVNSTTARIALRWDAVNGIDLRVNGGAITNLAGTEPLVTRLQLGNIFDLSLPMQGRLIGAWGTKARPNDAAFAAASALGANVESILK